MLYGHFPGGRFFHYVQHDNQHKDIDANGPQCCCQGNFSRAYSLRDNHEIFPI